MANVGAGMCGPCETCGKIRYRNRKKARARAKMLYPGDHMSTYRCGEYWHIGHIPRQVLRGYRDRSEYAPKAPDAQEAG